MAIIYNNNFEKDVIKEEVVEEIVEEIVEFLDNNNLEENKESEESNYGKGIGFGN